MTTPKSTHTRKVARKKLDAMPGGAPRVEDALFTEFEAAEYLRCSVHTLRADRRNQRRIPFTTIGLQNFVRYRRSALDRVIAENELGGSAA